MFHSLLTSQGLTFVCIFLAVSRGSFHLAGNVFNYCCFYLITNPHYNLEETVQYGRGQASIHRVPCFTIEFLTLRLGAVNFTKLIFWPFQTEVFLFSNFLIAKSFFLNNFSKIVSACEVWRLVNRLQLLKQLWLTQVRRFGQTQSEIGVSL